MMLNINLKNIPFGIAIFIFCILPFTIEAQSTELKDFQPEYHINMMSSPGGLSFQDDDDDDEEDEGAIPVFVALQTGLYFANSASANYYNGTVEDLNGVPVIDNIFNDPNKRRDIREVLGLSDSQLDGSYLEFNYNMSYEIGYLVGFQSYFGISKRMWILLDINFVQLNTSSVITLNVQDPNLPNTNVIKMPVYGQEQRFIVDLGAHWILGKNDLKGFIETGGNFLSAKVKSNKFDVEDAQGDVQLTYNLMPTTNNLAANTITSFTFGAFLGGGIFYGASENFALEAGFQVGYNQVIFPGYNGYFPNYLVTLRFIYLGKHNDM